LVLASLVVLTFGTAVTLLTLSTLGSSGEDQVTPLVFLLKYPYNVKQFEKRQRKDKKKSTTKNTLTK
jgi:hypothetical protein